MEQKLVPRSVVRRCVLTGLWILIQGFWKAKVTSPHRCDIPPGTEKGTGQGRGNGQGKMAQDKEKGRREEVPAFSCYEPAGGGAGWSPRGAEGGGSTRRVSLDRYHHTPDRF